MYPSTSNGIRFFLKNVDCIFCGEKTIFFLYLFHKNFILRRLHFYFIFSWKLHFLRTKKTVETFSWFWRVFGCFSWANGLFFIENFPIAICVFPFFFAKYQFLHIYIFYHVFQFKNSIIPNRDICCKLQQWHIFHNNRNVNWTNNWFYCP